MENLGPFSRDYLRQQGIDDRGLASLLTEGALRRVARGWFADPFTSEAAIRAVRLGGRLGCYSACRLHGLWVPPHRDLHVALNPGIPGRVQQGVQFHRLARPCSTAVLDLADSVRQVLHRHDEESALIVLESAVNLGLLHEADARAMLSEVPMPSKSTQQHFSASAQSGSETRLRLFFQRRRIPVTPQAAIEGIGRVDLLVGKSWIIEADSGRHHSDPRNVEIDCARDMAARELGYMRDRLSYQQIWVQWPRTQEMLLRIVAQGHHLKARRPLGERKSA